MMEEIIKKPFEHFADEHYAYYPALGGPIGGGKDHWKKLSMMDLTWWTENSPYFYPYILISYYYGKEIPRWRQYFEATKGKISVIADSGGFQILKFNAAINPGDVIDWQQEHADIGFALDHPPIDPVSMSFKGISWDYFTKCAEKTKANTELMLNRITKPKSEFKFYGVLQGQTIEHFDYWWKCLGDVDRFDGLAVSPKPPNALSIAVMTAYLKEKGWKKPVHGFMFSSYEGLPFVIYLSKYFERVTTDSSSYSLVTSNNQYIMPNNFERIDIGRRHAKENGAAVEFVSMPCDCPVCMNIEKHDLFKLINVTSMHTQKQLMMSLHNLYMYLRFIKQIRFIATQKELFQEYVSRSTDSVTKAAWSFWNDYEDRGFEKAYKKHFVTGDNLSRWL